MRNRTIHSAHLGCDMHYRVYGKSGLPLLAFPTQDGMCNQWEDFGMVDLLAPQIASGRIMLFTVDTVDRISWSASRVSLLIRSRRAENYSLFIEEELIPVIRKVSKSRCRPLVLGCSLGATHAANVLCRRPDLFSGMIGLSGAYDASYFTKGRMNDIWEKNSTVHFLPSLSADSPKVRLLQQRSIVLCVGGSDDEKIEIEATDLLDRALSDKGIEHWTDRWGREVCHDWVWWKPQLRYFLPFVLDEIEKREL